MIISFAQTTPALLAGVKTVTRRAWKAPHAYQFHNAAEVTAYDRSPRVGGKPVACIRLTAAPVLSDEYPAEDYIKEGLAWLDDKRIQVFGMPAPLFWEKWVRERPELWVVRFQLEEIYSHGRQVLSEVPA